MHFLIPGRAKILAMRLWRGIKKRAADANLAEWVMAVAALAMIATSYLQWSAIRGQLKEMRSAGKQTDRLVEANQTTSAAAKDLARIATEQFELTERPRVSGALSFTKALTIDRNGMRVNFRMVFTNQGLTPAIKASVKAETFPLQISGPEPDKVRQRVCRSADQRTEDARIAFSVYPGIPKAIAFSQIIYRRPLDEAAQRVGGWVSPAIVVCVAYHSRFTNSIYHTAFVYNVTYAPDPKNQARRVIKVENGSIPVKNLDFRVTRGEPEIIPDY